MMPEGTGFLNPTKALGAKITKRMPLGIVI